LGAVLYSKFHFCEYFYFGGDGFCRKGERQTGAGRMASAQRTDFRSCELSKIEGAAGVFTWRLLGDFGTGRDKYTHLQVLCQGFFGKF
jgi:hypothetical protein